MIQSVCEGGCEGVCESVCERESKRIIYFRAVVMVKWSVCSPSTPTIQVQIPLKATLLSVKFVFVNNKINKKRSGLAHL